MKKKVTENVIQHKQNITKIYYKLACLYLNLVAPAFSTSFLLAFAKTYCFLPMQVPQNLKLVLVQVQDSMLYVFYCNVLLKKLTTINYLWVAFCDFCSKYQVFFCLLWV